MTYEDRLLQMAAKLSIAACSGDWEAVTTKGFIINRHKSRAAASIQETADCITVALSELLDSSNPDTKYVISGYLVSNGFIPSEPMRTAPIQDIVFFEKSPERLAQEEAEKNQILARTEAFCQDMRQMGSDYVEEFIKTPLT